MLKLLTAASLLLLALVFAAQWRDSEAAPALSGPSLSLSTGGKVPQGHREHEMTETKSLYVSGELPTKVLAPVYAGFPLPPALQPGSEDSVEPADASVESAEPSTERPHDGPAEGVDRLFVPPVDAVVPKMTGFIRKSPPRQGEPQWRAPSNSGGAIANPARYFMEGASLEKVAPPKCRLLSCDGPVPNDADFALVQPATQPEGTCHQTFVPLNGCTDGKGYPVGMVCTICCDCAADLVAEMRKSRGFQQGLKANPEE